MNVYIISDTHFNHKEKMVKWCGRPENYEELLTKNLRQLTEKDIYGHDLYMQYILQKNRHGRGFIDKMYPIDRQKGFIQY